MDLFDTHIIYWLLQDPNLDEGQHLYPITRYSIYNKASVSQLLSAHHRRHCQQFSPSQELVQFSRRALSVSCVFHTFNLPLLII
jgi:hypothetical protein